MSALWYLGQGGIVVEILSALWIVYSAYDVRLKVRGKRTDLDHLEEALQAVLDEVTSQFKKQLLGFVVLTAGLLMQFAGNFQGL